MADLHATFIEFDDCIKLTSSVKRGLRTSRDSIRRDIKGYFALNKTRYHVNFKGQGSFVMNTTILPLSNEFDVDDGVYIFGKEEDKPSTQTVHNWVYEAVKNRTNQETIDKNTCVRVQYAAQYHVDIPIYYKTIRNSDDSYFDEAETPELAHKSNGWIPSDPYAFKLWFDQEAKDKPQLKRIVRYLKAWTDNKRDLNGQLTLPSGLVLTILACSNYHSDNRDDISLLQCLKNIQNKIDDRNNSNAHYSCYRPVVDKTENLLLKYSSPTVKENFLNALNSIIISGNQANEMKSLKDACAKWQKHLGVRFPCTNIEENPEELAEVFSVPEQIIIDNKSAIK